MQAIVQDAYGEAGAVLRVQQIDRPKSFTLLAELQPTCMMCSP